jgi:hypothetical protein
VQVLDDQQRARGAAERARQTQHALAEHDRRHVTAALLAPVRHQRPERVPERP